MTKQAVVVVFYVLHGSAKYRKVNLLLRRRYHCHPSNSCSPAAVRQLRNHDLARSDARVELLGNQKRIRRSDGFT
jgi:hypothetical protein